ncbi:MAG: hypothetical protein ACTTHI_04995 [Prevotella sp.]
MIEFAVRSKKMTTEKNKRNLSKMFTLIKKRLIVLPALLLSMTAVHAQSTFHGVFNRLGANVGVGTEGISFGLGTTLTPYLELGLGMNFFPAIQFNSNIDVGNITSSNISIPVNNVDIKTDLSRTTLDLKAFCYPAGAKSSFFLVGGFSFGGAKLADVHGQSQNVKDFLIAHPEMKGRVIAELDKYPLSFDEDGSIKGSIEVKAFRPYLGLGFGRMVPKHRVGVRFEMGCHFHGKLKVMQNGKEVIIEKNNNNPQEEEISKVIDKLVAYPVLKLSLTGRIL